MDKADFSMEDLSLGSKASGLLLATTEARPGTAEVPPHEASRPQIARFPAIGPSAYGNFGDI